MDADGKNILWSLCSGAQTEAKCDKCGEQSSEEEVLVRTFHPLRILFWQSLLLHLISAAL